MNFPLETFSSSRKGAINMSAEIQPTKIWLAENGTTFLSQPARVRKELAEVSNVWPEHRQS